MPYGHCHMSDFRHNSIDQVFEGEYRSLSSMIEAFSLSLVELCSPRAAYLASLSDPNKCAVTESVSRRPNQAKQLCSSCKFLEPSRGAFSCLF